MIACNLAGHDRTRSQIGALSFNPRVSIPLKCIAELPQHKLLCILQRYITFRQHYLSNTYMKLNPHTAVNPTLLRFWQSAALLPLPARCMLGTRRYFSFLNLSMQPNCSCSMLIQQQLPLTPCINQLSTHKQAAPERFVCEPPS